MAEREPEPPAGPELIRSLERTLGVAVIVRSIEDGPPTTISAVVLFGRHSEAFEVVGDTEREAWRELTARIAAWRTTDDKHVPWWGGAGGI